MKTDIPISQTKWMGGVSVLFVCLSISFLVILCVHKHLCGLSTLHIRQRVTTFNVYYVYLGNAMQSLFYNFVQGGSKWPDGRLDRVNDNLLILRGAGEFQEEAKAALCPPPPLPKINPAVNIQCTTDRQSHRYTDRLANKLSVRYPDRHMYSRTQKTEEVSPSVDGNFHVVLPVLLCQKYTPRSLSTLSHPGGSLCLVWAPVPFDLGECFLGGEWWVWLWLWGWVEPSILGWTSVIATFCSRDDWIHVYSLFLSSPSKHSHLQ